MPSTLNGICGRGDRGIRQQLALQTGARNKTLKTQSNIEESQGYVYFNSRILRDTSRKGF